ncbi:MAG: protein kinase [Myxococcaceae bacterium]|nr:protein kinase [Myxococcaceae bacterium]
MAEIYLAAAVGPEGFEKEVVIKVVRSFLARDDGFMKMFVDEARLASRLNHANIVQIFDFAKHDDSHFIAMEFVRGVSLWDLRRRCRELGVRIPPSIVAEVGVHVARGLQYAHSLTDRGRPLGLVHRDVTPHNVLISYDGAIKLTDFGIAKASNNQSSTAAGMLKGKFAYMSPEQARGEKIDARTDVFALGIVLWEMLTGGRLFEGESDVQVLRAVQQSYISPPRRLNPDVPQELDDVVMKALERDENQRFRTAHELERGLASFNLRHSKSVEDTNVGMFVSMMFKDELDEMRAAENAEAEREQAPPGPPPTGSLGLGATAVVQRDHSQPRPSAPEPQAKPRTAMLPGSKARAPDADDPSKKRTDPPDDFGERTRQTATPLPSEAVVNELASTKPLRPEQIAALRTTQSVRASLKETVPLEAPVEPPPPAEDTSLPPAAPRRSPVVWLVAGLAALGFAGSTGYLMLHHEPDPTPLVVNLPPPPSEKPVEPVKPPAEAAPVEKPVEKPPEPVAEVKPEPKPEPKPQPAVTTGTLEVDVQPFATLKVNGRPYADEVIGIRRFPMKPGQYTLEFRHPKRVVTTRVNITSGKVTQAPFRAFDAP